MYSTAFCGIVRWFEWKRCHSKLDTLILGMGFRTGCWDNKKWSFPPGFPRLRHVTPKKDYLRFESA